ncbi:MAG: hypothetical protein KGZ75_09010 [Syntrophomonadaceae bacterium]|nr:hypothetical protein [Syntrophomonadaceae bacterium]
MIGNSYLQSLCDYPDEDTSINQLLELLKAKDKKFIDSLTEEIDINLCNEKEIEYLTKASALIDYNFQLHNIDVPAWLRNEKLIFKKPYYHSKRITDFEKIRLMYISPAPFRQRNVYFDLESISRV